MNFQGDWADFNPHDINFSDFEQCPDRSILLWLINAGLDLSEWISRLPDEKAKLKLKNEIKSHALDKTELEDIIKQFQTAQGLIHADPLSKSAPSSIHAHLVSCATCGTRKMSNQTTMYQEVSIAQVSSLIRVTGKRLQEYNRLKSSPVKIPTTEDFQLKEIQLEKVLSIYKSPTTGCLFNIHPELVHIHPEIGESFMMCPECYNNFVKKEVVSPNSIAAGIDLGDTDRLELVPLNILEKMLISRLRVYHAIVRIKRKLQSKDLLQGSRMHGHAIIFPHDSPQVSSFAVMLKMLTSMDDNLKSQLMTSFCDETIAVQFLSPEDTIDQMMIETFGTSHFTARAHVVQQWLIVLQKISHAGYMDDPNIDEYAEFQETIFTINKHIKDHAQKISDTQHLQQEEKLTDSPNYPSQNTNNGYGFSYSFVRSQSDQQTQNDPIKDRIRTMLSVAESCNISLQDRKTHQWVSRRNNEPFNSYLEQDSGVTKAFPDVFPLGKAYPNKVNMQPKQIQHLLLQFNCKAATSRELLFFSV